MLNNFRLDHLDIQAATAGTIANAKNWTIANSKIQSADGSKLVFNDSLETNAQGIAY